MVRPSRASAQRPTITASRLGGDSRCSVIPLRLEHAGDKVKSASWAQALGGDTGGHVDRKAVFLYELASAVENDKPIVHKNMRFIAGPPVFVGQVLYEVLVIELDRRQPG